MLRFRHTSIVLAGQGKWARLIADGLRSHADLDVSVVALDSVSDAFNLATWRTLLRAQVVVRIGFRPGARTWRGRAADAALRMTRFAHPGQRTAYYWIGTDLVSLTDDYQRGVQPRWLSRELSRSSHAATTTELASHIKAHRLDCEVLIHTPYRFPHVEGPIPPIPDNFCALTYIPAGRQDFYGAQTIVEAARQLPQVRFVVAGTATSGHESPPNVEYLGWRDDISTLFERSAVVIRMPVHDGLGGTALEGLAYGRPVIYSRNYDRCIFVRFGDINGLVHEMKKLQEAHMDGRLVADTATALRIRATYAPTNCYPPLAEWLIAMTGAHGGARQS